MNELIAWKHIGMGRSLILAVLAVAGVITSRGQTSTGQISGKVVDATSQAVAKALVVVNIRPNAGSAPGSPITPFTAIATTAADGSFVVTGVPAGTFVICPEIAGADLLPTCTWQTPPSVVLAAGKAAVVPTITMNKGVHLPIRIDDPTGATTSAQGTASGASLAVDIIGTQASFPTTVIGVDATGYNRDALVPFNTPVRLAVSSKVFALADSTGAAVDKNQGASVTVTVPSGSSPAQIKFKVTGFN